MALLRVQSHLSTCDSAPPEKDPWDDTGPTRVTQDTPHVRLLNVLPSARWGEGTQQPCVLFLQLRGHQQLSQNKKVLEQGLAHGGSRATCGPLGTYVWL